MLQIHHLRVKSVVKLSVISFVIVLLLMLSCFPAFAAPAPEHSEPGTYISSTVPQQNETATSTATNDTVITDSQPSLMQLVIVAVLFLFVMLLVIKMFV
ncbi:unknown [Clostridium sp. CAG:964]|nr:unknown [Clostridium sp. CAG:964]